MTIYLVQYCNRCKKEISKERWNGNRDPVDMQYCDECWESFKEWEAEGNKNEKRKP